MRTNTDRRPWHCLAAGEAAELLAVDVESGLSDEEAAARLDREGPNRLPSPPRRRLIAVLLDQFRNLLILILLCAAGISFVIGDLSDGLFILAVTIFNGLLGFRQEWQAEKIFEALQRMVAHLSRLRRAGRETLVASDEIVRGDVVILEAGDRVPADGRLIAAHQLEIDESLLTGETAPVPKDPSPIDREATPLTDRHNIAFMNCLVTRGRGVMLVTATGRDTEIGRLAGLVGTMKAPPTPLQERIDRLGKRLAVLAVIVVLAVLAMGLWRGESPADMVMTSIALAVASIPEGLPATVTITLAIGMARMTRRGAVVTRMASIETLGCTTVICSDKTGTLTLNRMAVREMLFLGRRFQVTGEGYDGRGDIVARDGAPVPDLAPLLVPATLCNDARIERGQLIGDPGEAALLALAEKAGFAYPRCERVAELPFDSTTRFMATFHRLDDGHIQVNVKGGPRAVLALCSTQLSAAGVQSLDEAAWRHLEDQATALGGEALRVLALASGHIPAERFRADRPEACLTGLTFTGMVGLMDPTRPEARRSIDQCRRAGIEVKMITGDHAITAVAIAGLLGLEGEVLTGAELDGMTDAELAAKLPRVAVFARTTPEHKLRVVRALRAGGAVVAATGDGVNDAAALRAADIGVAMGLTGSDVAREAAAMVLTDDNFATIVRAVREGRTIYDNIVKFVRFQLSTNIGAMASVFVAPLLGLPIPFHPIHILWANTIMDGPPAMALAFDPPHAGIMEEAPRPRSEDFLPWYRLGRLAVYGATMAAGTLGLFMAALASGRGEQQARTLAFTTFVLFQFFNLFNARVGSESAFGRNFPTNGKLWLALIGVIGLQVLAVEWSPLQAIFHTTGLPPGEWAAAFAVASAVVWLDEVRKFFARSLRLRRRRGNG